MVQVKAIIGLGNPGLKYRATRHNVGFLVVKELARKRRVRIRQKVFHSLVATTTISGESVILAQPLTYMNLSGQAVREMVKTKKIALKNLLVICDDVSLPVGRLRIRAKGSDGGHKGLRSIIEELGSENFTRLRVGVGSPNENFELSNYVLSKFDKSEVDRITDAIEEALICSQLWIKDGITTAMNRFNRKGE